jgi:PilZ domain
MLKRADVVFNNRSSSVSGLVRNISDAGAMFLVESAQELPSHVSLRFANGEEFDCDVVRTRDGVEFGLKFCNPAKFDLSKTRRNIDAIYQIAKNLSPFELHRMMEVAEFFGDEEIERIANAYVDAYHEMVEALQDKILPKQ